MENNIGRTCLFNTIRGVVTPQSWKSGETVDHPSVHFLRLISLKSNLTEIGPALSVNGFHLQSTALNALQVLQHRMGT